MPNVALIKPPATYADWYTRPVLGLSYLSAYLEQNGFDCRIFDAVFRGWSEEELVHQVETYCPDLIGVTAMTHEITEAAHIATLLKDNINNVPTVVGGPHITALPERTLAEFPAFDFGVSGEGEKTIVELARFLFESDSALDLQSIKGLVFRNKNEITVNEPQSLLNLEELDALPYPAFDQYYGDDAKALAGSQSYYVIATARGCPYNCSFCMQVLGRQVRSFSPERVVQEIEYGIARYGAHTINFDDEIFLFDNKRSRKILQLMIDRGLPKQIRWSGLTRANMVNQEIIALAKQAGCYRLEMGVESGDNGVLERIRKKITVEQAKKAVEIIKSNNISLGTYFILGHPNETKETVRKTVNLAAELNTDTIAVGIMVPYPGTDIYKMAKRGEGGYRLLSEDWSEYDKYGGKSLELEDLTYDELVKYQKLAYIKLYLKNFRILDISNFIWQRKRSLWYFFSKKLKSRLPGNGS